MKTSAVVLFVLGILLAVTAFLDDKADSVPFVLRLVASEYTEAQSGLVELGRKMTLSPGDPGFEGITNIFMSKLAEQNPADRLAGITVMKIERHRPEFVLGKLRAGEVIRVTFYLSNGKKLDWSLDKLSAAILALKTGRIFRFSVILLVGGILIQVFGFMIQAREARPKQSTSSGRV